jgi:hypothetical protein
MEVTLSQLLPGIDGIYVGGENVILPWGIEFAGRSFFYTLNEVSHNVETCQTGVEKRGDRRWLISSRVISGDGVVVNTKLIEEVKTDRVYRAAILTTEKLEWVTGLAMRYQFKNPPYTKANIGGKDVPIDGKGIFHMCETSEVILDGTEGRVSIRYLDKRVPSAMRRYVYVRSLPGVLIVHLRVLPDLKMENTRRIFRISRKLETWDIFDFRRLLLDPLLQINFLWRFFWHRCEKHPRWKFITAYGLYPLHPDDKIEIRAVAEFKWN